MHELVQRYLRWVDSVVPSEWADDQRMRARFSVMVPAPMVFFAWCVAVAQFVVGSPIVGAASLGLGVVGLATMFLVRWTRSLFLSVTLQLGVVQASVMAVSFLLGFSNVPAVYSSMMTPVLAAVMLGKRAAVVWGAISASWMVILYGFTQLGWTPVVVLPPERLALTNLVAGVFTMAMFVVVALVMESMRDEHIRRLERATERADEALRTKSEFLANMSHEIRTPLHGVLGCLELFRGDALGPQQRQLLETAASSGAGLLDLVNEILDHAKIEAGGITLEIVDVDLLECVEQVATSMSPLATARGLELVVDLPRSLPRVVKTDGKRLGQVLTNLVGNAIKFTDNGHVLVRVGCDGESSVSFEVSDTGPGMSREDQQRLFLPFEQGDTSASRRHSGTGLGLSISDRLVRLLGGSIAVESELGTGSRFSFVVSVETVVAGHDTADKRVQGLNVLLVACSDVLADSLERMLRAVGAERVERAPDGGIAALDASSGFDVVLADLEQLGGPDALRELATSIEVPVVAMSSAASSIDDDALDSIVLQKPVLYNPLARALSDAVSVEGRTGRMNRTALQSEAGGAVILVADDNPVNQRVTQAFLKQAGYQCDLASNGEEALERFVDQPSRYAAVLMDCHMPVLDGYEATRSIREKEDGGRHIPIIALTADAMPGTRDRVLTAGMDAYLTKPFGRADLVDVLTLHCLGAERRKSAAS